MPNQTKKPRGSAQRKPTNPPGKITSLETELVRESRPHHKITEKQRTTEEPQIEPLIATDRQKARSTPGELVTGEFDPNKVLRRSGRIAAKRLKETGPQPRESTTRPEPEQTLAQIGQEQQRISSPSPSHRSAAEGAIGEAVEDSFEDSLEDSFEDTEEEDTSESSDCQYEDILSAYYKRVGYLPPLDDSAFELLEIVLPDPELIARMARLSASKSLRRFQKGLMWRNVALKPTHTFRPPIELDAQLERIQSLKYVIEPEDPIEKDYNDKLWELDSAKCVDQSQEPIFQRTVLISMIDRYRLIYKSGVTGQAMLDFAVEGVWQCPPMPTKAAWYMEDFLTKPKPDLAVAFRRQSLFPQGTDLEMFPPATQKLICFESIEPPGCGRAFHFLTVEAKKPGISITDEGALAQCLNNASQALHNMYEFFREADNGRVTGTEKKDEFVSIFFNKVRFFSVVATSSGTMIRIHRACRILPKTASTERNISAGSEQQNLDDPVKDKYLLKFVYEDYWTTTKPPQRQEILQIFAQILYGYGVGQLAGHLKDAIKTIDQKCRLVRKETGKSIQRDEFYYSYGQAPPKYASRAGSNAPSNQTEPSNFNNLNLASQASSFAHNPASQIQGPSYNEPTTHRQAGTGKKRHRTG